MTDNSDYPQNSLSLLDVLPNVSDKVAHLYLVHVPQYLDDLLQAHKDEDLEAIRFHAHKLASVMDVMDFDQLAKLLRKIENENMKFYDLKIAMKKVEERTQITLEMVTDLLS